MTGVIQVEPGSVNFFSIRITSCRMLIFDLHRLLNTDCCYKRYDIWVEQGSVNFLSIWITSCCRTLILNLHRLLNTVCCNKRCHRFINFVRTSTNLKTRVIRLPYTYAYLQNLSTYYESMRWLRCAILRDSVFWKCLFAGILSAKFS